MVCKFVDNSWICWNFKHQMVNDFFGSCHVVAWDLDAPTFPNSFMDAPCGPKAPLYWPISKFLRWTDPLPPEERISVSANSTFCGQIHLLHFAYFCILLLCSHREQKKPDIDTLSTVNFHPMYKHLDLCKNWAFIWRQTPYVVISAATSSFHPVPSVAMKCIRDQAAMATAKMKTRIVNRFACRSSLADASDDSFLNSQCDCDVRQTTRTPRNAKSQIQWDQLFSNFFPFFFSFSVDSCIVVSLMI